MSFPHRISDAFAAPILLIKSVALAIPIFIRSDFDVEKRVAPGWRTTRRELRSNYKLFKHNNELLTQLKKMRLLAPVFLKLK